MPDHDDETDGWLRDGDQTRKTPHKECGSCEVFSVQTGPGPSRPEIVWSEDGQSATVTFPAERFEMRWHGNPDQPVVVQHELSRADILWLWGNIDRELIREVIMAERRGTPSDRLAEVARIMGFDQDGD